MPPAARVQDLTGHPGGVIAGPGVASVLIGHQAAAVARLTLHTCGFPPPAGPHPPSTFPRGSGSVFIGGSPALRQGDTAGCLAPITTGFPSVLIGG